MRHWETGMTQEDLNQIRAVVREEARAVVREETRAIVREETRAIVREEIARNNETLSAALREEFAEKLGAAAVSFSTDFSELRKELGQRIDTLDRRMGALEHRMDRLGETTATIAQELATLTRWANRLDRENLETLNTQAAQQRAIDDLAKRLRPPQQPSA
jgi:ABC-type transporter Mla subunit MlaD